MDTNFQQNDNDPTQNSLRQSRQLGVKVHVEDISSDNDMTKHRTFQSEMISPQNSLLTNFEESKLSGIGVQDNQQSNYNSASNQ